MCDGGHVIDGLGEEEQRAKRQIAALTERQHLALNG